MHKYRNQPIEYEGQRFASKLERDRYIELRALEKAGEIENFRFQHKIPLCTWGPPQKWIPRSNTREKIFIGYYIADFTYNDKNGKWWVEDTKGYATDLFKWKKKHFEAEYGTPITLIRKGKAHAHGRGKKSQAPRLSAQEAQLLASQGRDSKRSTRRK
jgi:hypothetical protein